MRTCVLSKTPKVDSCIRAKSATDTPHELKTACYRNRRWGGRMGIRAFTVLQTSPVGAPASATRMWVSFLADKTYRRRNNWAMVNCQHDNSLRVIFLGRPLMSTHVPCPDTRRHSCGTAAQDLLLRERHRANSVSLRCAGNW